MKKTVVIHGSMMVMPHTDGLRFILKGSYRHDYTRLQLDTDIRWSNLVNFLYDLIDVAGEQLSELIERKKEELKSEWISARQRKKYEIELRNLESTFEVLSKLMGVLQEAKIGENA